jgi:protein-S-isoprenylcysteine O-methyltransferase Ste14
MLALNYAIPIRKLIPSPYGYVGSILMLFGFLVMMKAHNLFQQLDTAIRPDENPTLLVQEGPFKISRHPMYLGFVLILLGIAILLGNLSAFISPVLLFLILNQKFIKHEEQNLELLFQHEYLLYKKKSKKWI